MDNNRPPTTAAVIGCGAIFFVAVAILAALVAASASYGYATGGGNGRILSPGHEVNVEATDGSTAVSIIGDGNTVTQTAGGNGDALGGLIGLVLVCGLFVGVGVWMLRPGDY